MGDILENNNGIDTERKCPEEVWTLPGGFTHSNLLYEDYIFLKLLYLVEKTPENEPLDLQMRKLLVDYDELTKSNIVSQNISDREYFTSPLFIACLKGKVPIVDFFLTKCKPNTEIESQIRLKGRPNWKENLTSEGRKSHDDLHSKSTPLWIASNSGKTAIVKLLIEHGADLNSTSTIGITPVHTAWIENHFDVIKILVENNADINKPDMFGKTCLMTSINNNQILRFLLDHGAMVNVKDE